MPPLLRGLDEQLGEDRYATLRDPKTQMALALGRVKRPDQVYGGTVPEHVVARRRAKNKLARAARRINRGRR